MPTLDVPCFKTLLIAAVMAALPVPHGQADTLFSGSGEDPAALLPVVEDFRNSLGTFNAPAPVRQPDGRRQIDWDAAPAAVSTPNAFPGDFFNADFSPRARGIAFTTPGTGFLLSGDVDDATPTLFTDINASYADQFQTFSPERLFTAIGSNQVEARFFLPDSPSTPALVDGFGAVFADVDVTGGTSIDFYDINDNLLRSDDVPSAPSGYLSFLGVHFDDNELYRVVITSGTAAIGPDDDPTGGADIVVMDDFIFGEPQAIPEPSAILLVGSAMVVTLLRRNRRIR